MKLDSEIELISTDTPVGSVVGIGDRDVVEVMIELDVGDVLVPGRPFQLSVPVNVVVVAIDIEDETEDIGCFDELTLEKTEVKVVEIEPKVD